jgi:hypothetical protein
MDKLFGIVNALDIDRLTHSYDEYRNWCDETGEDPLPMRHFRYELSELDQKWVILDAMQRQVAEDPGAETVSSEHILRAIGDNSFPPSLEAHIEGYCEEVLVAYQRPPSPQPG